MSFANILSVIALRLSIPMTNYIQFIFISKVPFMNLNNENALIIIPGDIDKESGSFFRSLQLI